MSDPSGSPPSSASPSRAARPRKWRSSLTGNKAFLWEAAVFCGICLIVFGYALAGFSFLLERSLLLKGLGVCTAGTVLLIGCWGYFRASLTLATPLGSEKLEKVEKSESGL